MATIIKAGHLRSDNLATQKVAYQLDDMTVRASDYLDRVRKEASRIIAEAQKQAEAIQSESKAKGMELAHADARSQIGEEIEHRWQTLMPALEKGIDQTRRQWMASWEQNLVRLATQIAARIVRRELKVQPDIPLELIREALELASGQGTITLHLHPEDHTSLGDRIENLAGQIGRLGPTNIVADDSITQGGCKVVSQFGVIDQQIESQLARIERELSLGK